jgi:hypothetical protein
VLWSHDFSCMYHCLGPAKLLPDCRAICSYQRTCPVYKNTCQDQSSSGRLGIVHLCVGNAGAQFYNNGFPETPNWIMHEVCGWQFSHIRWASCAGSKLCLERGRALRMPPC